MRTGTDVVNVSHPDGAFKRVAFGEIVSVNWNTVSSRGFSSIRWSRGTVEGGSSGSGVFRESDGRLIGVIGGSSAGPDPCDLDFRAYYNRFDRIYDAIEEYLGSEDSLGGGRNQEISVVLGSTQESVTLVTTSDGGYTLNGQPIESGAIVSASNGNEYRLSLDLNRSWKAFFIERKFEVVLSAGVDRVTIRKREDGRFWLGNRPLANGSAIHHDDRGSYRLLLQPGGVWTAEPLHAPVQFTAANFAFETAAGSGVYGFGGDGSQAVNSRLANPSGVAVGQNGEIFIADSGNHRIRKVDPSGVITTLAGTGVPGYSGDGRTARRARLRDPRDVAIDSSGALYVADSGNHRIRLIDRDGVITTLAGTGRSGFSGDHGSAPAARLGTPNAVAVDSYGTVYVADTGNHRVRKISNGTISTIAGTGFNGHSGDGGPATSARLAGPSGIAVDLIGNVIVADTGNHRVRKINLDGIVTTLAGTGQQRFGGDGGPASAATLRLPRDVAIDWRGSVYVADSGNHALRRIAVDGRIETVAGLGRPSRSGDGGPAQRAGLSAPDGIWLDRWGDVYVADVRNRQIRRLRADWRVIPPQLAPVPVLVSLGSGGSTARLWRSGQEYSYQGEPFEIGWSISDFEGELYRIQRSPGGGLLAEHDPSDSEPQVTKHRLAAEQGDPASQYVLGSLHYYGDALPLDLDKALYWFRLAAGQNHPRAQAFLGYLHEWGVGLPVDHIRAMELYRLAADQGYSDAQFRLGLMFHFGRGVARDYSAAHRLYRLAARKDHARAEVYLGRLYLDGLGAPHDFSEAAKWFRLAAQQGDPYGQIYLGIRYRNGEGVATNHVEAARWFRLAANQGLAWGQSWLGTVYADGDGVRQDAAEAVRWHRLAAVQGYAFSQWQLGQAYARNSGVARNYATAHVWLSLAVENGEEDARSDLEEVERKMSRRQIAEAVALRSTCLASGYTDCP